MKRRQRLSHHTAHASKCSFREKYVTIASWKSQKKSENKNA